MNHSIKFKLITNFFRKIVIFLLFGLILGGFLSIGFNARAQNVVYVGGTATVKNPDTEQKYTNNSATVYDILKYPDKKQVKLKGRIFIDGNRNSSQDAGEDGISGVIVEITLPDGQILQVVTDSNGDYQIDVPENVEVLVRFIATKGIGGFDEFEITTALNGGTLSQRITPKDLLTSLISVGIFNKTPLKVVPVPTVANVPEQFISLVKTGGGVVTEVVKITLTRTGGPSDFILPIISFSILSLAIYIALKKHE